MGSLQMWKQSLMATKKIAQSHTTAKIQSEIQIHKSKQLAWASNALMLRLELILCRKKITINGYGL